MSNSFKDVTIDHLTYDQMIDEMVRIANPDPVTFTVTESVQSHLIPKVHINMRVAVLNLKQFKQYVNENVNHFPIDRTTNRYALYHQFLNQLHDSGTWLDPLDAGLRILDAELTNY